MAYHKLQSEQHKSLLDIVDRLRLTGVTHYVDLPQIVVCGDQSAGKSSVLEAISGLRFPTRDNLCTKFATEVVLRRDNAAAVKVSIIPGPDRNEEERTRLSIFNHDVDLSDLNLSGLIEEAKHAMGLSNTKVFSNDILRVEFQGPQQPHLTLVDLPGLYRAGNSEQSVGESEVVRKLVREYMEKPRSIILAVVSAKSDFALQEVTTISHELDPDGMRTLGLITKPDTLSKGSESEAAYVKMARNKDVAFRLGWHVLKNRSFETRDVSSDIRNLQEVEFFRNGPWNSLDPSTVGIKSLVPRLSDILKDQILRSLPGLHSDVMASIRECKLRLAHLGESRMTLQEQQHYLRRVSWQLSGLLKAAIDGAYTDSFFGSANSEDGQRKRLRAVIQNSLEDLSETMRKRGHAQHIIDDDNDEDDTFPGSEHHANTVTRSNYLESVKMLMRRSRGTELPGTFNPSIIGELFRAQCQPWPEILMQTHQTILRSVRWVVKAILTTVAAEDTRDALFTIIVRAIDELGNNAKSQANELLRPHLEGHPITYNHYLISTVQKVQASRRRREIQAALARRSKAAISQFDLTSNVTQFIDIVQEREEVNMGQHGGQLALDYMHAYYQVAMKTCVDDFSIHAIEQRLVQGLLTIFDHDKVEQLSDVDVANLAAEKATAASDRLHNTEKLDRLQNAIRELESFGRSHTQVLDTPSRDIVDRAEASTSSKFKPEKKVDLEPTLAIPPVKGIDDFDPVGVPVTKNPFASPTPPPIETDLADSWGEYAFHPKSKSRRKVKSNASAGYT